MTIAGPLLAEDQDRPYEYHTFAVGDRVRVRLSPECEACYAIRTDKTDLHFDGAIGTVHMVHPMGTEIHGDHNIQVRPDVSWWEDTSARVIADFASAELELLDPEASE